MTEAMKQAVQKTVEAHRFKTLEGFAFMAEREFLRQLPADATHYGVKHFADVIGAGHSQVRSLIERHGMVVVKRQGHYDRRNRLSRKPAES